ADSRSDAHGGRRLIRIDGGYLVLNFIAYRDRDYTGATRQKAWRERTKTGLSTVLKAAGARCECCGEPFQQPFSKYVVQDHDHKRYTGRGVICQSCNKIIGQLENG